jgi:hypothetical protein
VEINSGYNPSIYIYSNISSYDSISLSDSFLVKYEIEIDTGSLFYSELFIGNYLFFRSEHLMDSLWFISSDIGIPGEYTLTQVAYFRTYSGSLADRYNAEFIPYDSSWTFKLYIDLQE